MALRAWIDGGSLNHCDAATGCVFRRERELGVDCLGALLPRRPPAKKVFQHLLADQIELRPRDPGITQKTGGGRKLVMEWRVEIGKRPGGASARGWSHIAQASRVVVS